MSRKYTRQQDIADELNISRTTVSRALNNRGRVSEETRKKVLNLAREMGYKTDMVASALARKKVFKIKMFLVAEQRFFWDKIEKGVRKADQELVDYGIDVEIIRTSINNFEEQVRLLSEVEEDAVDGIIISPLDLKGIREVVNRRKFNPEKTPIVTLNMDLEHSRRLFYVGPDYRKSGKLAAEVMIKLISYQGKVAFLTSDYRTESIVEREKGFQDKISCYPELKLIKVTVHDLAELPQITRALLEKHPDLKGMVSSLPVHNDYRQALQELKENKLRVVAFDLTRETRDCIKDDLIQAAILQRPFYQGYYVIRMLFNYLVNGFRPEQERNCIALDIAMSENVDLIEDIEEGKYL